MGNDNPYYDEKTNTQRIELKFKSAQDVVDFSNGKLLEIINDSPKIAKKVNADGCHIGQLDPSITYTKKILKKKIIGVTCHGSIKIVNKVIKNILS